MLITQMQVKTYRNTREAGGRWLVHSRLFHSFILEDASQADEAAPVTVGEKARVALHGSKEQNQPSLYSDTLWETGATL